MSQTVEVIIGPEKRTPPPAPAPVNQEPPPPPATPDEIQARSKALYDSMGWGEPEVAETPPSDQPAGDDAPNPPGPETTTEPAIAPPPTPEPEPEPEPELSTADIIDRTAERVGRSVADALRQQTPEPQPEGTPAEPEPTLEMGDDDKRDYSIIAYLERANPAKHAGAAQQFLDYVKAHYAYQDAWTSAHPGENFDPDAEEHAEWYGNNPSGFTREELDDAKVEMRAEQIFEKKMEPQLRKERLEKAFKRDLPKIAEAVDKRIMSFISQVNPEVAKLLVDEAGKSRFTDKNIEQLHESEPIVAEVLEEITKGELEPLLLELEKTTVPELEHKIDPRSNSAHAMIDRFRAQKEQELAAMPAEKRRMDGRDWMTIGEMQRRESQIIHSKAPEADKQRQLDDLNSRYWTLGVDHLEELIVDNCAKKAKAIIEKRDKTASKKYGTAKAPATNEPNKPPPNEQPSPSVPPRPAPSSAGRKPNAPSISSGSDVVSRPPSVDQPQKTWGEEAADVHFK